MARQSEYAAHKGLKQGMRSKPRPEYPVPAKPLPVGKIVKHAVAILVAAIVWSLVK